MRYRIKALGKSTGKLLFRGALSAVFRGALEERKASCSLAGSNGTGKSRMVDANERNRAMESVPQNRSTQSQNLASHHCGSDFSHALLFYTGDTFLGCYACCSRRIRDVASGDFHLVARRRTPRSSLDEDARRKGSGFQRWAARPTKRGTPSSYPSLTKRIAVLCMFRNFSSPLFASELSLLTV
jgi:hypothetical protein